MCGGGGVKGGSVCEYCKPSHGYGPATICWLTVFSFLFMTAS